MTTQKSRFNAKLNVQKRKSEAATTRADSIERIARECLADVTPLLAAVKDDSLSYDTIRPRLIVELSAFVDRLKSLDVLAES